MTAIESTAADQLAELEERVRNGDTTVTPAALTKARELVRLAELQGEAAARAAQAEHQAALDAAQQHVRTVDFRRFDSAVAATRSAYGDALVAVRMLVTSIDALQVIDAEVRTAARRAQLEDEWTEHRGRHDFRTTTTLATLLADASGKVRTRDAHERPRPAGKQLQVHDRRWHDDDALIADMAPAIDEINTRILARRAEAERRQAETDARRQEAGLDAGDPTLKGNWEQLGRHTVGGLMSSPRARREATR